MNDPNERPLLDYATPRDHTEPGRLSLWFNRSGTDSFLGCSALMAAIMPWPMSVLGLIFGGPDGFGSAGCLAVPLAVLAVVLGLGGLVERGMSRMFPVWAIGLAVTHLLATFVLTGLL